MKEITATTTQRDQVTMPVEVRRLLSLKPGDKVAFTIEDGGEVCLVAPSSSIYSAYGSVQPSRNPEDFDEVSPGAKEAKVEETTCELSRACVSSVRRSPSST